MYTESLRYRHPKYWLQQKVPLIATIHNLSPGEGSDVEEGMFFFLAEIQKSPLAE